ncbi:hypothetical protein [Aquincola sp. J276]|uniref:hypothetical protein n=1 Tax=Aquincola sp. J276 TaxID=2898432 RepID=UPI0021512A6A|nr:hypothetical protein [Aquincola sp. J276]MCR5868142.1 hypothetical protein [Aquincola sp. J276]
MSLLLLATGAHAFSCAPTGTDVCELQFNAATLVFDQGTQNFFGETQFSGSDGSVSGYSPGDFPELTVIDTAGGTRVGFFFHAEHVGPGRRQRIRGLP